MKDKQLLILRSELREYIWGGSKLKTEFGYDIPSDHTGECWGISAHPTADCKVINGSLAGKTLSELWKSHPDLFGNFDSDRFPLLVKIIDAKEDLSIQVHPDDDYAKEHEHGSLGKSECWYVLDCEPGTTIIVGHHAKNHEEVKKMIEEKDWKHFLREIPIHKGDFFQIDAGTLHAIKGGTVILETQQNSDITYRVYDYDRLQDGKPRQLHVQQSIDCIKAPYIEKAEKPVTMNMDGFSVTTLVTNKLYEVIKVDIDGKMTYTSKHPFADVSVIEGSGTIDGNKVQKGTHLIVPYGYGECVFDGNMSIIMSYTI